MKNNAITQAKKVISYRTICFFSPSPQSSTRRRSGGGERWSTCIKRWNVATLSPRRRGDTARPIQGDRRKPRERRRSPKSRRVGGAGNPQSSTRRRSGGGKRWSTCIKRWNVATLSPRRRGDTARPTSTQPEESAGRLPGWIKIPSRPGTCIRRGSRAPQAADHRRGERANRGETTSRRRAYSPAGMAGCAPEAGGSSVAMGDCPLSAGKNSTPSVPPGRWAVRRKRINVDIWKKIDVVNERRAPPAAPVGNSKACPPKPPPHNRKPRGTAGAWKEAEGRTPTAGRGIVRRPAACIRLSPLGAVSAHAAQQSVGRLRTALRQGGIASLARDNPISRPRVQRPRLRRHRPLSRRYRPTRGTSSPFEGGHILRRRQHIAHRRVHIPRSRGHISRSRRHRPFGEERIEERRGHRPLSARHRPTREVGRPTRGTSSPTRGGHISRRRGCLDQFAVCVERK